MKLISSFLINLFLFGAYLEAEITEIHRVFNQISKQISSFIALP